jgi:hypothetical protein
MNHTPPPLRRPHLLARLRALPLVQGLRPVPLRAARWGLVAALSALWAGAVALSNPADWASPPRAAWWRTEGLAEVRGLAGAHCTHYEGASVCVAYGQGMAFSIEGGGSRVALPMVGR